MTYLKAVGTTVVSLNEFLNLKLYICNKQLHWFDYNGICIIMTFVM